MKKKVVGFLCDIGVIFIGGVIYAVAINTFTAPNKIVVSGITGIGSILNYLFNIPIGLFVIAANVLLFLLAFRFVSKRTLFKSAIAIVITSALIDITAVLPWFPKYTDDPLLACVFGGALTGIGLGIIFMRGITTGGVDLIALLLEKLFPFISYGKLLMFIDMVIVVAAGLVSKSLTAVLYAAIIVCVYGVIVDKLLNGLDSAKVVYIISNKGDAICAAVTEHLHRGVTRINAFGGYTNEPKPMLMTVVRPMELFKLKQIVKGTDEHAFVIVGDVSEVVGRGFKTEEDGLQ